LANDIKTGVWYINTAPFAYVGPVKIANLNITDCTAADHVIITNTNGDIIVDFTATTDELQYRIGWLGWQNGITIGAGDLGASAVVTIAVGAGK
jgi:hypothetical protein